MTDTKTADDAAKSDAKEAKASVVKNDAGEAVLDFATFDAATAQAKALGKGAKVEHIGTAFHVATGDDD